MAEISRELIDQLTRELNALSESGKRMILNALETTEWKTIEELRDIMIDAMDMVCGELADLSAARTAEFYDAVRTQSIGKPLGAMVESGYTSKSIAGAVRATLQSVVDTGDTEKFAKDLTNRVDYEVKKASGECIYANGLLDKSKPRFARVPSGSETCSFCLMLASRGYVYRTVKSAGSGGHYHPNCDCRIVPGFGDVTVEGYDPDSLYYKWKGMEQYAISEDKLTKYALNYDRDPDKALAFEKALGITLDDSGYLIGEVYTEAGKHPPIFKCKSEWGDLYYHDLTIKGKNGKTAKVRVAWISKKASDKMRMTTIFVNK